MNLSFKKGLHTLKIRKMKEMFVFSGKTIVCSFLGVKKIMRH